MPYDPWNFPGGDQRREYAEEKRDEQREHDALLREVELANQQKKGKWRWWQFWRSR